MGESLYTYWTVTGTGTGSLTYLSASHAPVQQFAGIETLIGNGANDDFRLVADGISINIRGGNSTGVDTVAFNGELDLTLGQQDVVGVGITEIEAFEADPTKQNTLRSSAAGGSWILTGSNSGTLVSGSERRTFKNFQNLLGGKGANLAEMTRLGLPVPPGFTITTEVCSDYYATGRRLPEELAGVGRQ